MMAKAKTKPGVIAAAAATPTSLVSPATLSENDVARRAYALYLGRDREQGHDLDDWLQAERALRASFAKPPGSLANVAVGDVLVSHPTAVREHEISIVPNAPHDTSPTHDAAVAEARAEADALGIDAWLTEDQTHVVKIASNRTPDE